MLIGARAIQGFGAAVISAASLAIVTGSFKEGAERNRALGLFVNALFGTRYSDLCYGYNAFWARVVPVFGLTVDSPGQQPVWGDGFEIETLINLRASAAKLKIAEVPSFEHARIHGESNLKTFRDGQRVLRTIVTERRRLA